MTARRTGPIQLLLAGYLLFLVAAGGRSAVQLAGRVSLPHVLSAVAAALYLTGLVVLAAAHRRPRLIHLARACCLLELTGVLAVGVAGLLRPSAFPDTAVWSGFGSGYAFVPLLLPVAALAWLHRRRVVPAD